MRPWLFGCLGKCAFPRALSGHTPGGGEDSQKQLGGEQAGAEEDLCVQGVLIQRFLVGDSVGRSPRPPVPF